MRNFSNRKLFFVCGVAFLTLSFLSLSLCGSGYDYSIQITVDPDKHLVRGKERVTFTNTFDRPLDRVVFVVRGNFHRQKNPYLSDFQLDSQYPGGFDSGWTRVESVRSVDDKSIEVRRSKLPPATQTYSLDDTLLMVKFETPLSPGEQTTLELDFSTKFPYKRTGDEEFFKQVYVWRMGWYPTLTPKDWWVENGNGNYTEFHKLEIPTSNFHVDITAPQDWIFAGHTTGVSESGSPSGWVTRTFHRELARTFPLVFGPRYLRYSVEYETGTISVLYFPGYQEEARIMASYAVEALRYFSDNYGPYPFQDFTIAQSPVEGQFGLAADKTVIIGNSFFTDRNLAFSPIINRLTDYLMAHEIAHQWFGMAVGTDFNAENWISEGFAEYLSLIYFEHKYGSEGGNLFVFERRGLLRNLIQSQIGYMNLRKHTFELPYVLDFQDGFDESIIKPMEDLRYLNSYQTRVYKKGYLALRTLRNWIGEKSMNEFLRSAFSRFGGDITSVEDLHRLAEEVSGRNLDHFFQSWLRSDRYLDYGIESFSTSKIEKNKYKTRIVVTKRGTLVSPVSLRASFEDGEGKTEIIRVDGSRKLVVLETKKPVTRVVIDPGQEVMDVNRVNNFKPRKVEIAFSGNKLPLDAYLLRLGPGTISGSLLGKHQWTLGPGYFQGMVDVGRDLSLSGGISLFGGSLSDINFEGAVGLSSKLWNHPQTGQPGKYWEQTGNMGLSLNRVVGDGRAHHFLGGFVNRSEQVAHNRSFSAEVLASPGGWGRLSLTASDSFRFLPHIYLEGKTTLGVSGGGLPDILRFRLSELKSFGDYEPDYFSGLIWNQDTFPGNFKLYSRLDFTFPLFQNDTYYLGNLAAITGVRESFWIAAGETWDTPGEIGISDVKVEGGTEFRISGKTLGGLIPVELTFGYAYHGENTGHQYLSFQLGV